MQEATCEKAERVSEYALNLLPAEEVPAIETHIAGCGPCRAEFDALRALVDSLVALPNDVLRPSATLQARLSQRIAQDGGADPLAPPRATWTEPDWDEVAPGISCKVLAHDEISHRVSMLVRLLPNVEYPPHTHADIEELHLLAGELWIDDRKLLAGDYNRADPLTADKRVWSETGCTCVLITSTKDVLTT